MIRSDVGMIQCGEGPRFTVEARETLSLRRKRVGQNSNRDVTAEIGVRGPVDLAHATDPDLIDDLVRAEPCAREKRHESEAIIAVRLAPLT